MVGRIGPIGKSGGRIDAISRSIIRASHIVVLSLLDGGRANRPPFWEKETGRPENGWVSGPAGAAGQSCSPFSGGGSCLP
ncbi:hypothetical protein D3227_35580 [Mesorhizobium waimense]|uniref:Uncharacterized protein n=1 Tax=Mesorhizobium waimense TaxID=1300307 RepID=A0A3A5JZD8_9HYPH|nr:hypothetical protein D3227_35580 [Mesorhizobium waimense]